MFSIQSTVYRVSCTFYNKYLDNSTIQLTYVRVPVRLDHDGLNMIFLYVCTCTCPFGPWWTEHHYSLCMFVYQSVWTMMDRTSLFFMYVRVPVRLDHDGPNMIILYVCSRTSPFGPWRTNMIVLLRMYVYSCPYGPWWTEHYFSFTYVRVDTYSQYKALAEVPGVARGFFLNTTFKIWILK